MRETTRNTDLTPAFGHPSPAGEGNSSRELTSGIVRLQRIADTKVADAKIMRRNMTPAEKVLWNQLRGRKIGNMKFRRQQIIEGFIADFYCEEGKFCVEVDGGIHCKPEQIKIDQHRTMVFNARGIRVLRFTNDEVMNKMSYVVRKIIAFSKEIIV